jgi:hypothetical protein
MAFETTRRGSAGNAIINVGANSLFRHMTWATDKDSKDSAGISETIGCRVGRAFALHRESRQGRLAKAGYKPATLFLGGSRCFGNTYIGTQAILLIAKAANPIPTDCS